MDVAKRKVMIKSRVVKKVEDSGQTPKGMGPNNPPTKRKIPPKQDRVPKKPKLPMDTVVGLEAERVKMVTPVKHGVGKGLMKGPSSSQKKPPILLREDPKYALEALTSIITIENYEDLSNHSIEAIAETGLFSIAQVILFVHSPSVLTFLFKSNPFSF